MGTDDYDQIAALRKLGAALFGRNNLIGTDFADARASRVVSQFVQDGAGIHIQFAVSNHALGKVMTREVSEALDTLLR